MGKRGLCGGREVASHEGICMALWGCGEELRCFPRGNVQLALDGLSWGVTDLIYDLKRVLWLP